MDCTYLWRRIAVAGAFDVSAAVVGELDSVRRFVQEDWSLQIQ